MGGIETVQSAMSAVAAATPSVGDVITTLHMLKMLSVDFRFISWVLTFFYLDFYVCTVQQKR